MYSVLLHETAAEPMPTTQRRQRHASPPLVARQSATSEVVALMLRKAPIHADPVLELEADWFDCLLDSLVLPKLVSPGGRDGTTISTLRLNNTLRLDASAPLVTVDSGLLLWVASTPARRHQGPRLDLQRAAAP